MNTITVRIFGVLDGEDQLLAELRLNPAIPEGSIARERIKGMFGESGYEVTSVTKNCGCYIELT